MTRWGYKTVHFAMKKEGLLGGVFLDETEIEQELNEFGRSGWELISLLEMQDGVIAFFKQPLGQRMAVGDDDREFSAQPPAKEGASGPPDAQAAPSRDFSRQPAADESRQRPERSGHGRGDDNVVGAIKIE